MQPTWERDGVQLYLGDCLPIMAAMPDNSIDLIATDPPYYKVKMECDWDRQWKTPADYLDWIGLLCKQWQRILKPNGSLYVFASPGMARQVANVAERSFCILNEITWQKAEGWHKKAEKEALRSYCSDWERIIFAEYYGADNIAKGEAGYAAKCDKLRGFVFEPLRAYLTTERDRAGMTTGQIEEQWQARRGTKGCMAGHWFNQAQWALPTQANYEWLRLVLAGGEWGGDYLRREYEDLRREYEDLRREYEDLRREYEDLRRPFFAIVDRPYTDVWTFATVSANHGKHPAEKPLAMMEHIILTSSKPGAVVLDCCMGRGTTGAACQKHGRQFIGIDSSPKWYERARERLTQMQSCLAF